MNEELEEQVRELIDDSVYYELALHSLRLAVEQIAATVEAYPVIWYWDEPGSHLRVELERALKRRGFVFGELPKARK